MLNIDTKYISNLEDTVKTDGMQGLYEKEAGVLLRRTKMSGDQNSMTFRRAIFLVPY